MPHAFRSAALIEAEAAQKKLDRLRERWASTKGSWFDGTPESVTRRIAWIDEVIATTRNAASRLYASKAGSEAMALLPRLSADRLNLIAIHQRLVGSSWVPEGVDPSMHNLNPHDYGSREEWMDAQNRDRFGEFGDDYGQTHDYSVPPLHEDMSRGQSPYVHAGLRSAAEEFIESQNTSDRTELRIRAHRLMSDRTSSWEPSVARDTVRAFMAAVDAIAPRSRKIASAPATIEDFDDSLIFG